MNNYEFSKWFNNEYIPNHEDKKWLKDASSKAICKTMMNCNEGFRRFQRGLG